MTHRRSLNTTGSIQVAERWRDGIKTYEAWFTFQPGRVGHGESRGEAIQNIPRRPTQINTTNQMVAEFKRILG